MNRGADAEALAAGFLARQGLPDRRPELSLSRRRDRHRRPRRRYVGLRRSTDAQPSRFRRGRREHHLLQRQRIRRAAQHYLARFKSEPPCRFDAVLLDALAADRIEWLRAIDIE